MDPQKSKKTDAAAEEKSPAARHVRYVKNRPYSAGEAPEVVPARVRREHETDTDALDLYVRAKDNGGEPLELYGVRRSERQDPGTWYEEVKS